MNQLTKLRAELHELWPRRNEVKVAQRIDVIAQAIHKIQTGGDDE